MVWDKYHLPLIHRLNSLLLLGSPTTTQTLERVFLFLVPHWYSPSPGDSAALIHPWLQASISKLRSFHLLLNSEISFSKIQEGRGGMGSVGGSARSKADLDDETHV